MEEAYRERYGVSGTVMYPMRNWEAPQYDDPPNKVQRSTSDFVVAYSGSLHTTGFRQMLHDVAEIVEDLGGHLLVFSHIDPESAYAEDWVRSSMDLRSFVPQEEIIPTLRREADTLLLPMAFEGKGRVVNQTNFPSKLAEYTATGLPLFVWGPAETSGVRWADSNPGVAEVVTSPESDAVRPVLQRLINDPDHRYEIGKKALEVGEEYFAPEVAWSIFCDTVSLNSNAKKYSPIA
jgi:glycosyltransferase involved in cell wall biosynthesis